MPAYKYKTEEEHQMHLAWRRDYYKRNRERIRERDNKSAQRQREKDPERFKGYQDKFRAAKKEREAAEKAKVKEKVSFADNPDHDSIMEAIRQEQEEATKFKKSARTAKPKQTEVLLA